MAGTFLVPFASNLLFKLLISSLKAKVASLFLQLLLMVTTASWSIPLPCSMLPCSLTSSKNDPLFTAKNSLVVATPCDPALAAEWDSLECSLASDARTALYWMLAADLDEKPPEFREFPFHKYISHATLVMVILDTSEHLLWLGHPSDHYLYYAHTHITGGLSIYFSFAAVPMKDVEWKRDVTGLNGEICWIRVTDHFACAVYGDTRVSNASHINCKWLFQQYSPQCPGKYVSLDQVGELYAYPAVRTLFAKFGYALRPTGADAFNQNGPVERAHLTVANALRAMLLGAGLDPQFWPYAFNHFHHITNATTSRSKYSPVWRPFVVLKTISLVSVLLVTVSGSDPLVVTILSFCPTHAKASF
ncbi:hypothetical protein IV203_015213 [Nitzschia inconspicua]|uniref:Uncharacterized protein n=1 Tax=Nitzschia inconspicua TaxID=303405 RepID=A0A9K3LA59_9STRA|nr:hypothetical protein IV203_015213 [Nitzschia inconspicua]